MINDLSTQKNWQQQISEAITDPMALLACLQITDPKLLTIYQGQAKSGKKFGLKVPKSFVAKMTPKDSQDPLLLQVLPMLGNDVEIQGGDDYVLDPLQEISASPVTGMLHKYQSRILLTVTGACAVHCRYCFRQHYDYQTNRPSSQTQMVKDYILSHPDVNEVIFSGGDPLSLNNRRLFAWLDDMASIAQITNIRLHTRLPIMIPERLDTEFLAKCHELIQAQSRLNALNLVMVVHTNHANEIDDATARQLWKLRQSGVTLLNQAVLLKGVNDTIESQVNLSQRLFDAGVLPYYLHLLDKVKGSAYFYVSESQAVALYWQMLERLSGYLLPKLVKELPNRPFKTPINIYKSFENCQYRQSDNMD